MTTKGASKTQRSKDKPVFKKITFTRELVLFDHFCAFGRS